MKRFLWAALVLLFAPHIGWAQTAGETYYVSASGNDDNNGLSEAAAFKSLRYAVEQASDSEDIKTVTVIGTLDQASEGSDIEILFFLNNGALFFSNEEPILITGIPNAPSGRRAVLSAAGTVKECVMTAGPFRFEHIEISGSPQWGLTVSTNSSVTLGPGSLVRGNQGGGVLVGGGETESENEFADFFRPGVLILDGGIVENNQRNDMGGGIAVLGAFTMKGGSVRNNTVKPRPYTEEIGLGGGIYVNSKELVLIEGGDITGNTAEYGGALAINFGRVTMTGGSISGNTAASTGGGVLVYEGAAFTRQGGAVRDNKAHSGPDIWRDPAGQTGERNFEYTVNDGTVTITGYRGSAREVWIPARIKGLPVTVIGMGAFYERRLTAVTIPDSVTVIEAMAFGWNRLRDLIIPDSVTVIGRGAFEYNQLSAVTIGTAVTVIGDGAFAANLLTTVTIPDSVTEIGEQAFVINRLSAVTIGTAVSVIGDGAFAGNLLTAVTIPDSVALIGDGAFGGNPLTGLALPAGVDIQVSSFYCLVYDHYTAGGRRGAEYTFTRSRAGDFEILVCGNAVEIIGFHGGMLTALEIPDTLNGLPVTAIGDGAFSKKYVTAVTIPDSVTLIGDEAFSLTRLSAVTIPGSVTVIGAGAFRAARLGEVTISDSVTVIGAGAFEHNRLSAVAIPDSVTVIGRRAFSNNWLSTVSIGRSTGFIGEMAFYQNQIGAVVIPDSVSHIGAQAFAENQIGVAAIPDSVTEIGKQAFYRNRLSVLTIGNSVSLIGEEAFAENQLDAVVIPASVSVIGKSAFALNQLTSVTMPGDVDIGMSSFYYLLYLHYTAGGRRGAVYTFKRSRAGDFEIAASGSAVEIVGFYGEGTENLAIPGTINGLPVTAIGDGAFRSRRLSAAVTIPDSVVIIGDWAFALNRIKSVTIPGSVIAIGEYAFRRNELSDLAIPDSVTVIGDGAFEGNQINALVIPGSVTAIGDYAFDNNPLTGVALPANVEMDWDSFPGDLVHIYTKAGRRAGEYKIENEKWRIEI
jgi:hypothetical protein